MNCWGMQLRCLCWCGRTEDDRLSWTTLLCKVKHACFSFCMDSFLSMNQRRLKTINPTLRGVRLSPNMPGGVKASLAIAVLKIPRKAARIEITHKIQRELPKFGLWYRNRQLICILIKIIWTMLKWKVDLSPLLYLHITKRRCMD